MSDRDALLRAVKDNPEDDGPRLVFADWLDEHEGAGAGKAAKQARDWAAVIRKEIAAGRLDPTDPDYWRLNPTHEFFYPGLEAASRLLPISLRHSAVYERGFPVGLVSSTRKFLKNAIDLIGCPAPLQRLSLSGLRGRVEELARRPELAAFRRFHTYDGLEDSDAAALAGCGYLTNYSSLDCGLKPRGLTSLLLEQHLSNLSELSIWGGAVGPEGLRTLVASPTSMHLRRLELRRVKQGPAGFEVAAASPRLNQLTDLSVSNDQPDDLWLEHVTHGGLPALTSLEANWFGSNRDFNSAAATDDFFLSDRIRHLSKLKMSRPNVRPETWAALPADSGPPGLHLSLHGLARESAAALVRSPVVGRCSLLNLTLSDLAPIDLGALAGSPYTCCLRVLRLGRFDAAPLLSGDALRAMTESPHLANLYELGLGQYQLDDDGLRTLSRATFASSLRTLNLRKCPLSATGLSRLADPTVFPNLLRIEATPPADMTESARHALGERPGTCVVLI